MPSVRPYGIRTLTALPSDHGWTGARPRETAGVLTGSPSRSPTRPESEPKPYGFTHWALYGLPPNTTTVGPGADATFRVGENGFGQIGWGGPEPPAGHGDHHDYFWVYALATEVSGEPTREDFLDDYGEHVIEQNRVVGLYAT